MLERIRHAADSIVFRIILFLIIIAFAIWGIKDVVGLNNNFDLVTFRDADPITVDDFVKAKSEEIRRLQRVSGIILSDEEIKKYGVNQMVLDRLVSSRLLDYVVKEYSLDFSEDVIASFIKQMPTFKDADGNFDVNLFKDNVKHSGLTEDEYASDVKQRLTQNMLINAFISSNYVPGTLTQSIIDFMSEERVVDVAYIDTSVRNKNIAIPTPTEQQLQEFYNAHTEIFTLPEKRSVSYILITPDNVKKFAQISNEDVKNFFNENPEEFGKAKFHQVEAKIKQTLIQSRTDELLMELAKNLEDEVAGGSTLNEIASKFGLEAHSVQNVTLASLLKTQTLSGVAESIFSMQQSEVSYPMDIPDTHSIVVTEVTQITPSTLEPFDDIKTNIAQKWRDEEYMNINIKLAQDLITTLSTTDFAHEVTKAGLTLKQNVILKRSELQRYNQYPPEMLVTIFDTKLRDDTNTQHEQMVKQIFSSGHKIFITKIKAAQYNQDTAKDITKNSRNNIVQKIDESMFLEIMEYIRNKEDVKIDKNAQILSE